MLIVRDSQVKKLFYKEQEIDKILDWNGNVVFEKESAPTMTNTIKFHTTSAVTSSHNFTVTYTDSTQDTLSYSEPSKEYSISIPTDKVVNNINVSSSYIDEIIVSCKINLYMSFFYYKPKTIRILNCDATSSTSLAFLFNGETNVETIEIKNSDFRNVTTMYSMFNNCSGAKTIGIANCDTSNVDNMSWMFYSCSNLNSLDLSNFDTSKVTNMSYMFNECNSLTSLDLSNFDTSKVTNMACMFSSCSNLTSLDLSNFDTSKVTDIYFMFSSCNKLTTIKMIGCNQTTIDTIKSELTSAGILNQVTIITE